MKKKSKAFLIVKLIIKRIYSKMDIIGLENITEEPVILVGNHAQIHGPLMGEFYLPDRFLTWCAGQMMNLKEVPSYAFEDFWSQKPKYTHCFYKVLSYFIAPLSVFIFQNARTIPVYRDHRSFTTFKTSLKELEQGKSILIFPEYNKPYNNIIYDFQERFIDLAKMYQKRTGKEIQFVPFYLAPNLKKGVVGKPISFSGELPFEEEREKIKEYLMKEITNMAKELPVHTVVPYRNIKKKEYPQNKEEEKKNEKTCCKL